MREQRLALPRRSYVPPQAESTRVDVCHLCAGTGPEDIDGGAEIKPGGQDDDTFGKGAKVGYSLWEDASWNDDNKWEDE